MKKNRHPRADSAHATLGGQGSASGASVPQSAGELVIGEAPPLLEKPFRGMNSSGLLRGAIRRSFGNEGASGGLPWVL